MNKTEMIARRILGWKLNRWDRWYDFENGEFINECDFQPDKNLEHALRIVDKLEQYGFTYEPKSDCEVCFNNIVGTGSNLAEAITDAAYQLADVEVVHEDWMHYQNI